MRLPDHPPTPRLMVQQLGLVTRRQLLALGWRADVIDGAVRAGALEVVHRAVYRVPGSARSPAQLSLAAAFRAGPGARLTGGGMLRQLGLEEVPRSATDLLLLLPPPRRLRTGAVLWRRDLAPDHDHLSLGPIPATTAARSFVEAADRWRPKRQLSVLDELRWRRHATGAEVISCAQRLGRRHAGARAVLQLLASGELEQESHGERSLAAGLDALGLADLVRWQVWVTPLIRVDALLGAQRVALEYDGGHHHTHPRDRRRDAARDRELTALGYRVVRLTKADVQEVATLRQRLEPHLDVDGLARGTNRHP